MPSKPKSFTRKYGGHIQLTVCTLIALSLAAVMLWGLVPVYDPQATLLQLKLHETVNQTIFLDIEMSNPNYFRGFNYTKGGWYDVYYIYPNMSRWELQWDYHPQEYQGFRKTLRWNITLSVTISDKYLESLKSQESYLYVDLYLSYRYQILFWTTKTSYYQWLDITDVYFGNNGFDYKNVTQFNRIRNFTLALS